MKQTAKTFLALTLLVLCSVQAFADPLVSFNLTDFLGWTYTRPDFKLSTDAIGANKVRLFKASNGTDYTLVSPAFATGGAVAVSIKATLLAPTSSSQSYDLTKGSPTFELLDADGHVVASEHLQYTEAAIQRDVQVTIGIPAGISSARLRIAAWSADLNSPVAVRSVTVEKSESGVEITGDDTPRIIGAQGSLIISNADGCRIAVRDLQGRLRHESAATTPSVAIRLAAGAYLVTVGGNKTTKVIIK